MRAIEPGRAAGMGTIQSVISRLAQRGGSHNETASGALDRSLVTASSAGAATPA